jgi:hypothetical protein
MLSQPKSNLGDRRKQTFRKQTLVQAEEISSIAQQTRSHLEANREKSRRESIIWDMNTTDAMSRHNTGPLRALSPQQRVLSKEQTQFLPAMYAPSAPTHALATPPSISHHQTNPRVASLAVPPSKIHTDKHDASEIALSIAMAKTVNHLIKRCIDEHETMPTRIRANALMALQFIRRGLIFQGHILYGSALIPFFTDPELDEKAICIDY